MGVAIANGVSPILGCLLMTCGYIYAVCWGEALK